MRPADALRLPRARLTEDQRKVIAVAVQMLEGIYEKHMMRSGISVDMQCDDPVVLHELERHCKGEGWITNVVPDWVAPRVSGGRPTLRGFKLLLTPPQSAYDEADAETRS